MRNLILLSIASLLLNVNVQAHQIAGNEKSIAQESLYNSIYNDFEQYYKDGVNEDISKENEQDALYNDLFKAFESLNKREIVRQEYEDENNDALFLDLSNNFNHLYTYSTISEEYDDIYNNILFESLNFDLLRHKAGQAYRNKINRSLVISITR